VRGSAKGLRERRLLKGRGSFAEKKGSSIARLIDTGSEAPNRVEKCGVLR